MLSLKYRFLCSLLWNRNLGTSVELHLPHVACVIVIMLIYFRFSPFPWGVIHYSVDPLYSWAKHSIYYKFSAWKCLICFPAFANNNDHLLQSTIAHWSNYSFIFSQPPLPLLCFHYAVIQHKLFSTVVNLLLCSCHVITSLNFFIQALLCKNSWICLWLWI